MPKQAQMNRDEKIVLAARLVGCKTCLTACAADVRRRQPKAALATAEALAYQAKMAVRELKLVLRRLARENPATATPRGR